MRVWGKERSPRSSAASGRSWGIMERSTRSMSLLRSWTRRIATVRRWFLFPICLFLFERRRLNNASSFVFLPLSHSMKQQAWWASFPISTCSSTTACVSVVMKVSVQHTHVLYGHEGRNHCGSSSPPDAHKENSFMWRHWGCVFLLFQSPETSDLDQTDDMIFGLNTELGSINVQISMDKLRHANSNPWN